MGAFNQPIGNSHIEKETPALVAVNLNTSHANTTVDRNFRHKTLRMSVLVAGSTGQRNTCLKSVGQVSIRGVLFGRGVTFSQSFRPPVCIQSFQLF